MQCFVFCLVNVCLVIPFVLIYCNFRKGRTLVPWSGPGRVHYGTFLCPFDPCAVIATAGVREAWLEQHSKGLGGWEFLDWNHSCCSAIRGLESGRGGKRLPKRIHSWQIFTEILDLV